MEPARTDALRPLIHALAWLILTATQLGLWPAFALDAVVKSNPSFTAPLPPARPASPAGNQATTGDPSPPAISTAPAETSTPPPPAPQPRNLPQATRARMHACGLEWQKMKESGAAADKVWLDFAQICLAK